MRWKCWKWFACSIFTFSFSTSVFLNGARLPCKSVGKTKLNYFKLTKSLETFDLEIFLNLELCQFMKVHVRSSSISRSIYAGKKKKHSGLIVLFLHF